MVAYPNELPLDAVTVLLGYVKGKAPATNNAVHAAWEILGYGLGKGLPTVQAYGDGDDLVDEEAALESLLSVPYGEGAPQGILLSVAIGVAIKIALRILKEIIA